MLAAQLAELRLEERFCGPPATANGGYACGAIAELLGDEVEVTLRRPPPLGRPLRLQVGDGGAVVHDGDELVAEACPATVALAVPGTASPAQARCAVYGSAGAAQNGSDGVRPSGRNAAAQRYRLPVEI